MRHYVVRITLHLGEYEKSTTMLVDAVAPELAQAAALFAESHNPTLLVWQGTDSVEDDYMVYSISGCDEVCNKTATLLEQYLPTTMYDREQLITSGNFLSQEVL